MEAGNANGHGPLGVERAPQQNKYTHLWGYTCKQMKLVQ